MAWRVRSARPHAPATGHAIGARWSLVDARQDEEPGLSRFCWCPGA